MKKETLEETAKNNALVELEKYKPNKERFKLSCKNSFYKGAKWQKEQMLKDMQEYAEFCVECDRKEMPLLLVSDWYEHYKTD